MEVHEIYCYAACVSTSLSAYMLYRHFVRGWLLGVAVLSMLAMGRRPYKGYAILQRLSLCLKTGVEISEDEYWAIEIMEKYLIFHYEFWGELRNHCFSILAALLFGLVHYGVYCFMGELNELIGIISIYYAIFAPILTYKLNEQCRVWAVALIKDVEKRIKFYYCVLPVCVMGTIWTLLLVLQLTVWCKMS